MDSRILLPRLLQCDVGDMFLVRNAGNIVPHSESLTFDAVSTEPGALELGCVRLNIPDVLVCGHSDCRVSGALGLRRNHPLMQPLSILLVLMAGHECSAWYARLGDCPRGYSTDFMA